MPSTTAGGQKAPMKNFISPTGEDIRITHPNGSVAIIGATEKPLPQHLWAAATRAGAQVASGSSGGKLTAAETAAANRAAQAGAGDAQNDERFTIKQKLKEQMKLALDAHDEADEGGAKVTKEFEDAFTSAGIPQVKWLQDRVGFTVSADQRDEAWEELTAELESGEEEDPEA